MGGGGEFKGSYLKRIEWISGMIQVQTSPSWKISCYQISTVNPLKEVSRFYEQNSESSSKAYIL